MTEDTLETTASTETPVEVQPQESPKENPAPVEVKPQEDWETRYKHAEKKIGQKTYAERVGDKIIEATGYKISDLESAGYSPDEITQAVLQYKLTGEKTEMPKVEPTQQPDVFSAVKSTVADSKADKAIWRADLMEFFSDNPDAKDFKTEIDEFHSIPQYRDMTPQEIFEKKIKAFVKKGAEVAERRFSDKEKAALNVSPVTAPEPDQSQKHATSFQRSRRLEDATSFVLGRLFK